MKLYLLCKTIVEVLQEVADDYALTTDAYWLFVQMVLADEVLGVLGYFVDFALDDDELREAMYELYMGGFVSTDVDPQDICTQRYDLDDIEYMVIYQPKAEVET